MERGKLQFPTLDRSTALSGFYGSRAHTEASLPTMLGPLCTPGPHAQGSSCPGIVCGLACKNSKLGSTLGSGWGPPGEPPAPTIPRLAKTRQGYPSLPPSLSGHRHLDLFQVLVTQVLKGVNEVLLDFDIQGVFDFGQALHRLASVQEGIPFAHEKRKGVGSERKNARGRQQVRTKARERPLRQPHNPAKILSQGTTYQLGDVCYIFSQQAEVVLKVC